jgi:hypothetical protein
VKPPHDTALFIDEAEAARLLGLSVNGLRLARQRGEVEQLYMTVGRRVLFCLPAIQLRALGLDAATLAQQVSARDLGSLIDWLIGRGKDEL